MSTTDTTLTGKKGDIRIGFGFMPVDGYAAPEPCIQLYTLTNKQVMVCLPACKMYLFDERDRNPITKEPNCWPKCKEIAEMLYGMPTSYGPGRVLSAISEWMADVKNMPPADTYRGIDGVMEYMKSRGYDRVEF